MKYFIHTYGCQMNKSDSERMARVLEDLGYKKAPKEEGADLIILNTCSVRQSAEDRVYGKLKNLAKLKIKNLKLKILVTGCMASLYPAKLKNKADLIFSIDHLPNLPWLLKNLQCSPFNVQNIRYATPNSTSDYLSISPLYQSDFHAFIPIMTGCNNFCSYCVVPYARGQERSRPVEDIIKEITSLIKKGFKAITLVGQNVNSYQGKIKSQKSKIKYINFPKLLKMVNDLEGRFLYRNFNNSYTTEGGRGNWVFPRGGKQRAACERQKPWVSGEHSSRAKRANMFWIWFITSHPKDMSDELIEVMAQSEKVCPYLHLPVQSGNNQILKAMNRGYTREDYLRLVDKIRKKIPQITLTTDVIVGFPGETKKQFQDTVNLFEKIKFDMAYIARYSPRPKTAAFKLKDTVAKEEKEKRWKILTNVLKRTALENNKKYVGKEVDVLIDNFNNKSKMLLGKTQGYKTVKIHPSPLTIHNSDLVGQMVKVKITSAMPWGLEGKLVKK